MRGLEVGWQVDLLAVSKLGIGVHRLLFPAVRLVREVVGGREIWLFADAEGRLANITVDFHTRSITIEVDLVLFTGGHAGKIETLPVYAGALVVRVGVVQALPSTLTAATPRGLSGVESGHRVVTPC